MLGIILPIPHVTPFVWVTCQHSDVLVSMCFARLCGFGVKIVACLDLSAFTLFSFDVEQTLGLKTPKNM